MQLPDPNKFPITKPNTNTGQFGSLPQNATLGNLVLPGTPIEQTPQLNIPETPLPPKQKAKNPFIQKLNELPLPERMRTILNPERMSDMMPSLFTGPLSINQWVNRKALEQFEKRKDKKTQNLVESFSPDPESKLQQSVEGNLEQILSDKLNPTQTQREINQANAHTLVNLGVSIFQSIARNVLLGGKVLATGDVDVEIRPSTAAQEALLGIEQFDTFNLVDEGRDIISIFGEEAVENMQPEALMFVGAISAFSDFAPTGGKSFLKRLASSNKIPEVVSILKKQFPNLGDNIIKKIAPKISKTKSTKNIDNFIKQAMVANNIPVEALSKKVITNVAENTIRVAKKTEAPPKTISDLPQNLRSEKTRIDVLDNAISKKPASQMLDELPQVKRVDQLKAIDEPLATRFGFKDVEEAKTALKEVFKDRANLTNRVKELNKSIKAHQTSVLKQAKETQKRITKSVKGVAKQPTTKGTQTKRVIGKTTGVKKTSEVKELGNVLTRLSQTARQASKSARKVERFKAKRKLRSAVNDVKKQFTKNIDNVDGLKKIVRDFVNSNIPPAKRTKLLNALASIKGVKTSDKGAVRKINDILQRSVAQASDVRSADAIRKSRARLRSNVAYIKKVGGMDDKVIRDVKKSLRIDKPLSKMDEFELANVIEEIKKRIKFKYDRGVLPVLTDNKKIVLNDEFYEANIEIMRRDRGFRSSFGDGLKKTRDLIVSALEDGVGIFSTEIKKIDTGLFARVRKLESNLFKTRKKYTDLMAPFLRKARKMKGDDGIILDLAMKNGDAKTIARINKKYKMEGEYSKFRNALNDMYNEAKKAGLDVGFIENFAPRVVKDSNGFLRYLQRSGEWDTFRRVIQSKEMEMGRNLTTSEKSQLISNYIRGYSGGGLATIVPNQVKNRNIKFLTGEMDKFYYDSVTASVRYIEDMTNAIETRKFLGFKKGDEFIVGDSITKLVNDLLSKNKITPEQSDRLKKLLNSRLDPKGPGRFVNLIKNIGFIDVLGNSIAALTQFGDIAFSAVKYPRDTLMGFIQSSLRRSDVSIKDLGVESIAQELSKKNLISNLVSRTFLISAFSEVDRIGKETLLNASLLKARRAAKRGDKKFLNTAKQYFDNPRDFDAFVLDMRAGRNTENVKFFMLNQLMDTQPIALSEVPVAYLQAGNGRVFYMLKTFGAKMIDIYRNTAIKTIQEGNSFIAKAKKAKTPQSKERLMKMGRKKIIQGTKDIMTLTTTIVLFNGSIDYAKDFILRKEPSEPQDVVVDNLLKIMFLNRFAVSRLSRDGVGAVVKDMLFPPTRAIDNLMDFTRSESINDSKLVRSVPIVGELYYWWFGRGSRLNTGSGSVLRGGNSAEALAEIGAIDFDFNFDFDFDFNF
jgi:hypothetical protein